MTEDRQYFKPYIDILKVFIFSECTLFLFKGGCLISLISSLGPKHTRCFAPGLCSWGTLWKQSSSVCTNDFMGVIFILRSVAEFPPCKMLYNIKPVKCLGAKLKILPCVYHNMEQAPRLCSQVCTSHAKGPWSTLLEQNTSCVSAFINIC